MADIFLTEGRLTREKQIYVIKVVCDMELFRNKDLKSQGKLFFYLDLMKNGQPCRNVIGHKGILGQ